MSRHARDLDACNQVSSLWSKLKQGDDVFIFIVGDTRYTIRGIFNEDNRYIIDASSVSDREGDDAKVRYILDDKRECLEVHYILPTDKTKERCINCTGINLVYCRSQYTDICTDCGWLKETKEIKPNYGRLFE